MKNDDYIKRSDAINALNVTAMLRNLDSVEDGPAHMYKRAAERIIAGVPAADVEPVRHGRWIWDDEGFHCSECWIHAYGDTCEVLSGNYHYCPNCGAKMEEEKEP